MGPPEGKREACVEVKHLLLLAHLDEGAGWGQFCRETEHWREGGVFRVGDASRTANHLAVFKTGKEQDVTAQRGELNGSRT